MISVIVPVYGVEKYLNRCVESIVRQTYNNLEIILVDDGSKDACPQMCDRWAEKDKRIKVIHKNNGGLGSARNAGLASASGDWISFVDSDDYLLDDTYKICINKLEETNADICYFGCAHVKEDGTIIKNRCAFPKTLENQGINEELLPKCFGQYLSDKYDLGTAWMGLYRADILQKKNIKFVSERDLISEDYVFTVEVCLQARKICFVDQCLYMYCSNTTSLTKTFREDRFFRIEVFYKNRIQLIQRLHLPEDASIRAGVRYWDMVVGCIKAEFFSSKLTNEQKRRRFCEIVGSKLGKELSNRKVLRKMSWKQQILIYTIRLNSFTLCKLLVMQRLRHSNL